jgi:RNA polymerase sigma-70 factor (ECF subfamily)
LTGDEAEVSAWISTYTPRLLGVARAFARDADEAEDLLQETWIVAYRKAGQRDQAMPIGAWLHAIVLSIGRTRWRRRARRARLFALWHGAPAELHAGQAPELNAALERARLWREVARLPDLQRRVLLLRIVEDMSTAGAAAQLGRSEGTVKASLYHAIRSLRRRLAPAELPDQDVGAIARVPLEEGSHD